jgi:GTP-binding protein
MEKMGVRKAELTDMAPDGTGRIRMDFIMPSRGLIGFQTEFMTLTSGSGLIYHTFFEYGPHKGGEIGQRKNGVMIANATGKALTNAIFNLQSRGRMLIGHGIDVYEGQVIGIHSRDNDLTVNALKGKQLTNVRSSGTDEAQTLTPPILMSLEQALEFIDNDELVEVTPESIRIRKKFLKENDRKREGRGAK